MPSNPTKAGVQSRLKAFFDIVLAEAEQNPAFYSQLESVLLSPEAIVKSAKRQSLKAEPAPTIILIDILHQHGKERLRSELEAFPTEQLIRLGMKEKILRTVNQGKKYSRQELTDMLIKATDKALNRGSSFFRTP